MAAALSRAPELFSSLHSHRTESPNPLLTSRAEVIYHQACHHGVVKPISYAVPNPQAGFFGYHFSLLLSHHRRLVTRMAAGASEHI